MDIDLKLITPLHPLCYLWTSFGPRLAIKVGEGGHVMSERGGCKLKQVLNDILLFTHTYPSPHPSIRKHAW
jgi:hypothetical protein